MRRAALALWLLAVAGAAAAQPLRYELQPRRIADGHWVIEGAVEDFSRANGCNIINTAFVSTGEGVVVINTGPSKRYGQAQREAVAATTREPVQRVLSLNLHPDYFFGHQAWADVPTQALAGTVAGMRAEGAAYADNLYRLCGDWMRDTEATPAREAIAPQTLATATRRLELRRLSGHTADDLVVIDRAAGVLYAGGLVFSERVPTTPHADFEAWLAALDTLQRWHAEGQWRVVVPSHGPVHEGLRGIEQTRDWLRWITGLMRERAERGVDLSELLREPVPARFAAWAAQPAEWHRTLAQWYPAFERRALGARR
jgi:quinoprotein relay system zinc metallohydrolase 1